MRGFEWPEDLPPTEEHTQGAYTFIRLLSHLGRSLSVPSVPIQKDLRIFNHQAPL